MNVISLHRFQRLSGLSDRALIAFLVTPGAPIQHDPEQGVMVVLDDQVTTKIVASVRAAHDQSFSEHELDIAEQLAVQVDQHLESVVTEVILRLRSAS